LQFEILFSAAYPAAKLHVIVAVSFKQEIPPKKAGRHKERRRESVGLLS